MRAHKSLAVYFIERYERWLELYFKSFNKFDNINTIHFNLNGSITDKKAIRYFVLLSPGSRSDSLVLHNVICLEHNVYNSYRLSYVPSSEAGTRFKLGGLK